MTQFERDLNNVLSAFDVNWDDYVIMRQQFINKYGLSVSQSERIREVIKANTHHCDFGCDNDCGMDGMLYEHAVTEIILAMGER